MRDRSAYNGMFTLLDITTALLQYICVVETGEVRLMFKMLASALHVFRCGRHRCITGYYGRGFIARSRTTLHTTPAAVNGLHGVVPLNYARSKLENVNKRTMSQNKDVRFPKDSIHPELLNKWEHVFHFGAANKDGLCTFKDLKLVKELLMQNAKLTPEQRDEAFKIADEVWMIAMGHNPNETMTVDQCMFKIKTLYDSGELKAAVTAITTRIFNCMDMDCDGLIDVNEFKQFFQSVGKINDETLEKTFKAIDTNGDGAISLAEYVDTYMRHFHDSTVKNDDVPIFGK